MAFPKVGRFKILLILFVFLDWKLLLERSN